MPKAHHNNRALLRETRRAVRLASELGAVVARLEELRAYYHLEIGGMGKIGSTLNTFEKAFSKFYRDTPLHLHREPVK